MLGKISKSPNSSLGDNHGCVSELPLDGGVEERMSGWVAANRQHRWGRHTYSLEPFGVDAEHIRARYAEYTERYVDVLDDQKADGTG